MKSQWNVYRTDRILRFAELGRIWLVFLFLALALGAPSTTPRVVAAPLPSTATTQLQQFKASGHILGFQPTKVYFAALNHALSVEFLGTAGVVPETSAGETRVGMTSAVTPPTRVTYTNLWRGISVTYDAVDGIGATRP